MSNASTEPRKQTMIERLFDRLATKYGRAFMARYEGLEARAVHSDWSDELRDYDNRKGYEIIHWALQHLPERPPNSIQFHNLCRQAPIDRSMALPPPDGKPLTEEQRRVLREAIQAIAKPRPEGKDLTWAHRVMGRAKAGEKCSSIAVRMAKEALGVRS